MTPRPKKANQIEIPGLIALEPAPPRKTPCPSRGGACVAVFSQCKVIWSIMRGHRLRYGFALACLIAATVVNFGIPLWAARPSILRFRRLPPRQAPRA